jgi:hypothetical protein
MTEIKPKKQYVNNADFLNALEDFKERKRYTKSNDLPDPNIPDYIGECFMKIAEGLSHKPNFINYTFRDEMIADGIENCLMYFENFDATKSKNPFAYFTQVIYFAFLRRIQKEKKQMYIKYKATEQMGILDEFELLELEEGNNRQFEMYDNLSEFIETFEESKRNKKVIKKNKGLELFFEE